MAQNIIIGGELEPRGASGIALDAQYVIDRTNGNVKQNAINTAVSTLSGGTNYVTIPATSSDTSIGDVFTRTSTTPSTDTLYRIGNWNYNLSPCYNINYYSVYGAQEAASIGSLVPVALSDLGIDDEPTAGSDNLVKSGGVISHYNFIKNEESKIITCTAGESLGRENTVIPISIKAGNQYSIYIESESILSSNPQYYCEFDDGTKLDFQVAPNVIALRTEQKNIKNVFLWISGSIISNSGNITFSIKQTGTINERINIIDSELTNINSSILDSHHDIIYTDFKISGITKTSTLTIVPNISNDFHIDINIPANSEFFVNFKSENLLSANPQLFVRFIDGSLASMAINKNQDWYKITISSPLLIKDVERVGIHIDGSAVQSSGIVTLSVKKEGFISNSKISDNFNLNNYIKELYIDGKKSSDIKSIRIIKAQPTGSYYYNAVFIFFNDDTNRAIYTDTYYTSIEEAAADVIGVYGNKDFGCYANIDFSSISNGSSLEFYNISIIQDINNISQFNSINKVLNDNSDWKNNEYTLNLIDDVICIGDSITEGNIYDDPYHIGVVSRLSYPTQLSKMTGWTIENAGFSGFSAIDWWQQKFGNYNYSNYRLAIIYLGTNGGLTETVYADAPSGTDYHNYANTNTGRLCSIIEGIKSQNSDIIIAIIIGSNMSSGADVPTVKTIKEIAERYSLILINLRDSKHLNLLNNDYHGNYQGNINYIHYNAAGYLAMAKCIKCYLEDWFINNIKLVSNISY